MAILAITVTTISDEDYDGNAVFVKRVYASLDGVGLPIILMEVDTVSTADCKTNYRARLTAAGYTWDSEV